VARVLAVVADLMLASRVEGSLSAAGHTVTVAPSLPAEADVDLLVCDLDAVDEAAVAAIDIPSLGFYSHLDVDARKRAEEAGIDLVVPRSRMARELPSLAERLLGAQGD
jgi:hypothetical protein